MESEDRVEIEHQNVPASHQGLHEFLYSSEDEHGVAPTGAIAEIANSNDLVPLETWCEQLGDAKVAGVYLVLSEDRQPQYIGYSRNVSLSLKSHLTQHGADMCTFVQVQVFKFPKREEMEKLKDAWIAELDQVPPGNVNGSEGWAGTIGEAAIAAMTLEERKNHEEKKLKLRKAMAENVETQVEEGDALRREKLAAALENDNWSAIIQEQTQETQA